MSGKQTPPSRPKLLLLPGANVEPGDLSSLLGEYEVVVGREGMSPEEVASSGAVVVMGGPRIGEGRSENAVAVLTAIGEGVCLTSREGAVLWSNEVFRGYDEQTRARISAVCRRAALRFEEPFHGRVTFDGERPGRIEERFDVASGDDSRIFEVVVSPVSRAGGGSGGGSGSAGQTGRVERVAAIAWDRTHSRRFERKMEAIDRAGAELVRLDAAIVRKMHVTDRLQLLEEKIVKFAHDLLNFDHFSIRLIDEQSGRLELVISTGLPPEAMEMEMYASRDRNGIMGYVAATGKSYLCPDVTKDPRYLTGLYNARSSLTIPLRLHDRIIGVLNVESERVAAFTEEDRQFAEMFGNHVALALHILDLLVIERCATGESVTGTVEGELTEPLEDILQEAEWLKEAAGRDPKLADHIERIRRDVQAIRDRVRDAAKGPQNILGAERALAEQRRDPRLEGRRILIADDEPRIRQIIRDVLRARGCEVTVCPDGGAAVEELEASAAGQHYDLIVSDIKMPDKNGYEVFSAARRVDPDARVILMTGFGYDPHHSIVRASQEGLQCVLFKPFQIERLLEEVYKALARQASKAR